MPAKIQILGAGCAKCQRLYEHAEAAAKAADIPYELEKVTDITRILEFDVMITPALVVNGVVKTAGTVPSVEQIQALLKE